MVDSGILDEDDKIELIEGEIVPMASKGRRHELLAEVLAENWHRRMTQDFYVSIERQYNLGEATFVDPDIIVRPAAIKTYDLKGPDALLVVEVADSSLKYDMGAKARIYASFGVREYCVINALTFETSVHTQPGTAGYGSIIPVLPTLVLTPQLVPVLAVRLGDLDPA